MVWLSEWKWFDRLIILIIAINSLFLPFYDYKDRDNLTSENQVIQKAGEVFTYIFLVEAVIKIISMGFIFHENSYLRDPWNWIDFTVVVIGIVEILPLG